MQPFDPDGVYRNLLILESRSWWESCKPLFDPERDVVLTYDLGLQREIERLGGRAFYVDHLIDASTMHSNNALIYKFFREWHWDANGNDIFEFHGVPFGFAFRLEIWNDLIFYTRTRICLEKLRGLKFEKLFVGTQLGLIESVLKEMELSFVPVAKAKDATSYYFPIHQWMDEKVRYKGAGGIKYRLRDMAAFVQGTFMSWVDYLAGRRNRKPIIFVQEYHPTRKLVQRLYQDARVRLVLATFSRNKGWFRYIPIRGRIKKYQQEVNALMQKFRTQRCAKMILSKGVDISDDLYSIIERRISRKIAESMRDLDAVIRYLDRTPIKLEVLIANIGQVAPLVDCVCKSRGIPSYFIINGMLASDFLDEGKYATITNSYSTSIKEHYFRGMSNIVCLGDPRMDAYAQKAAHPRMINREDPTVTIGASGHSSLDLNSYLAVEFEFLHEVLQALSIIKERGVRLRIVVKVRANGYRGQYERFVQEYFPGLVNEVLENEPMFKILERTDFYISIHSQTHFEASCMGIPCLYYRNETQLFDPPFDGKSELVTVSNVKDLVVAIGDFLAGHERYEAFLQRSVMERYIGPLDGGNLERNLNFIYGLLAQIESGAAR